MNGFALASALIWAVLLGGYVQEWIDTGRSKKLHIAACLVVIACNTIRVAVAL